MRNFLAGVITEVFLGQFEIIDQRHIPPRDWEQAGIIAKRVVKYDRQVPRRSRSRDREHNPYGLESAKPDLQSGFRKPGGDIPGP